MKGSFPHSFTKLKNFRYCGDVPDDSYYLSFGQTKLNDDTLAYLKERRASKVPWNFCTEMYKYCVNDDQILCQGYQMYLLNNFLFQSKLIERWGAIQELINQLASRIR